MNESSCFNRRVDFAFAEKSGTVLPDDCVLGKSVTSDPTRHLLTDISQRDGGAEVCVVEILDKRAFLKEKLVVFLRAFVRSSARSHRRLLSCRMRLLYRIRENWEDRCQERPI